MVNSLISLGVQGDEDPLVALRIRLINQLHLLYITGTSFLTLFRLIGGEWFAFSINLTFVILFVLSYALSYFGKSKYALHFSFHQLIGLGVIAFIYGSQTQMTLFSAVIPGLAVILCFDRRTPLYYYIVCVLIFIAFRYQDNPAGHVSFFLIVTISFLIATTFRSFLNKTYNQLLESLKEKNEALRSKEEANRDLVLFNEILAHDLKTPLRSINGFSQLLQSGSSDLGSDRYLEHISEATRSMTSIISDLSKYSKIDQTEETSESVDLQLILNDQIVAIRTNNPGLQVEIVSDKLPIIVGHSSGMRALFNNLMSNAIKFQPKANPDHTPRLEISVSTNDESLTVDFCDNGIGVECHYVDQLFKPFKRLHSSIDYEGTGLGLSICKKVMDKHGGTISLVNLEEKGTTFRVEFPRSCILPQRSMESV